MEVVRKFAEGFRGSAHTVVIPLKDCPNEIYFVPKALLCNSSKYFVSALEGRFKEGREGTLTLPGCDKETFDLFLYWLCNHRLPNEMKNLDKERRAHPQCTSVVCECVGEVLALIRLWCFADATLIPDLQNLALQFLVWDLQWVRVTAEMVRLVVDLTNNDSLLYAATMQGLAYDCKDWQFPDEEMWTFALIPGVMGEVVRRLREDSVPSALSWAQDMEIC